MNTIAAIVDAAGARNLPFVLSGGHAVITHGYARNTFDLDLVIEWGRVKLANRKDSGPAKIRLRFARETWDIILPSSDSEVCAELWDNPNVAAARDHRPSDTVVFGLFAKGAIPLQRLLKSLRARGALATGHGSKPSISVDVDPLHML